MQRVPLLCGSRVPVVGLPDDAHLLVPPPPVPPLTDVAAAVREALAYPIAGPSLADAARGARSATIVVEPPSLPLPGSTRDPRREALAAVVDALGAAGIPEAQQTLLVASGLGQRPGKREVDDLLPTARARDFRGAVAIHDCEDEGLVLLGHAGATALRCHSALVETDLVVTVSASETVLDGGASPLVRACSAGVARAATADSLLEARGAAGFELAATLEELLLQRAAVLGVAVVLDLPRIVGAYHGYPWQRSARDAVVRSPFRRLLGLAPASVRHAALESITRELSAVAVLAGTPTVAHAEALLRGTALKGIDVAKPFDTLLVPLPWKGLSWPRLPLDPVGAVALGLGLALRLWRGTHPLVAGGTIVLLHPLTRGGHARVPGPDRTLLGALRAGPAGARLREAEALAGRDPRALADYRRGRAVHPRAPFAAWDGCAPAFARAGTVIAAACRDAGAARAVGLVPTHNVTTALEMAAGVAGPGAETAVLLAPPYAPLVVG
jgi:hypothetical protein